MATRRRVPMRTTHVPTSLPTGGRRKAPSYYATSSVVTSVSISPWICTGRSLPPVVSLSSLPGGWILHQADRTDFGTECCTELPPVRPSVLGALPAGGRMGWRSDGWRQDQPPKAQMTDGRD